MNGDGINDLVIAAPHATPRPTWKKHTYDNAGEVYVVFGRRWPSGTQIDLGDIGAPLPGRLAGFRIDGSGSGHSLGIGTATVAGDVNGDGLDDVAVSPGPERAVYVIFGSTSTNTVDLDAPGGRAFRIVGGGAWSASGTGDINGDGLADVIVNGPCDAGSGLHSGCAYVVFGSANPTSVDLGNIGERGYAIGSSKPTESLSDGTASGGDINGDGWPDVVSGFGTGDAEGAYAVFGTPSTGTVDISDPGGRGFSMTTPEHAETGSWLAFAGNFDGKRSDDMIVSARFAVPQGRQGAGAAYVVSGTASTAPVDLRAMGKAGIELEGAAEGDATGRSVDGAGDVNGDGFDDVIVGAPWTDHYGREDSGSAYIVFGGTDRQRIDLASLHGLGVRIDGAKHGDEAGTGVAGVGDINGDGFDDVLIGAQQMYAPPSKGVAYVVYGRPWAADSSTARPAPRKPLPHP